MSTLSKSSLFWVSPEQSTVSETKLTDISSLMSAYVMKGSTTSTNLIGLGNRYTYSRIKKFEAGGAYIHKSTSNIQVSYARGGYLSHDNGRLSCLYSERFKITGLSGFWVEGNGDYVMTTFFKNQRPVYLNSNGWAVWYDPDMTSWVMTETLNLHPSRSEYLYLLSNGDAKDPAGGLYTADGTGQSGYGPNSVKERVVVSIPTDSYESPIRKISACLTHTIFLDNADNAWVVGDNTYSQLGDDSTKDRLLPFRVSRGDAVDIQAAHHRTFITKIDGSLWSVGLNTAGQTGIDKVKAGTNTLLKHDVKYAVHDNIPSLTKVTGGSDDGIVLAVRGSNDHTLVLKYEDIDGVKRKNLYACGNNRYGQLPVGNYHGNAWGTSHLTLVASDSARNEILFDVGLYHSAWVRQGTLYGSGKAHQYEFGGRNSVKQYYLEPFVVSAFGRTDCKKVVCGRENTIALLEDNTLWTTGVNTYGQCGLPKLPVVSGFKKILDGVKDVVAGFDHTIVLMQDGRLLSAGNNQYGQCATERAFATAHWLHAGHSNQGFRNCIIDGEAVTSGVSYIHAAANSTFFVKDDKLYACGYNVNGNLGDGSNDNLRYVTQVYPTG